MNYYNNLNTFTEEKLNKYLNRAKVALENKHKELEEAIAEEDTLHENSCYKVIDTLTTKIVELEEELSIRESTTLVETIYHKNTKELFYNIYSILVKGEVLYYYDFDGDWFSNLDIIKSLANEDLDKKYRGVSSSISKEYNSDNFSIY